MDFLTAIDNTSNNPLVKLGLFAWDKYKKNKIELLRAIIRSEMRQGDFSNVDSDNLVGICYRLQNDVMEGVAKNNLRLLCAMIAGINEEQKLTAQTFLKFAPILETLTNDEIKIIARDVWPLLNPAPKSHDENSKKVVDGAIYYYESEAYKEWKQRREDFFKKTDLNINFDNQNPTKGQSLRYALLRTGLYYANIQTSTKVEIYEDGSGNNTDSYTNVDFKFSSLMDELLPYIKNVILDMEYDK